MDGLIPQKHYNYLRDFFVKEPEWWEEIKNDIGMLRAWAKTIKALDWYDVDDNNDYDYYFECLRKETNSVRVWREVKSDSMG